MVIADELAVRVHGEDVGALALLRDGRVMFAFDPAFAQGRDRPTVSLSFLGGSGEARAGKQTFARGGRVPPYLSNLLPEGHLRSYLAAKAGVTGTKEYPLLRPVGGDMPGAVEVRSKTDDLDFADLRRTGASRPARFLRAAILTRRRAAQVLRDHGRGGQPDDSGPSTRVSATGA